MEINQPTATKLFEEEQKFRQYWILILLVMMAIPYLWFIYHVFFTHVFREFSPAEKAILLSVSIVLIFFFYIYICMHLDTSADETAFYYRFFPFQIKMKKIMWKDTQKVYIRDYRPIKEYGGWGIRETFNGKKAYNVMGNSGLQILTTNGKSILFGTQKKEELAALILLLKDKQIIPSDHEPEPK